ncbi:type I restriction enzyme specificity HsdS domain protein [Mycoplasma haemocanis str. Illinois]|uniref:Type I restriction enzyme specificity HsdS domain protein n=1 Tax=Mycoplasma haemocanis (strain Illinois) TaxID=1111676 RepID=H6N6Y3_MYCHN|nr:restriction endonuclease subunit S [Mycoplasma haemocanis]AEW45405.1 type I restriction enzyme specificity HsdS domain protein [Mycoplasma haemocanis str. Illinois]
MSFKSFLAEGESVKHLELGDVCKISTGKHFKDYSFTNLGMPIIKAGNIKDGYVSDTNLTYCDPKDHVGTDTVKYGDIVVVKYGSIGVVGINLLDQEFFYGIQIFKLAANKSIIHEKYLYHFLLSRQEEIKGLVRGSTIPGIRKSELEKIRIPIPSLEVQEKVANTLDKFREIEREIEREISLRDKQYEYYRNHLIMSSHDRK